MTIKTMLTDMIGLLCQTISSSKIAIEYLYLPKTYDEAVYDGYLMQNNFEISARRALSKMTFYNKYASPAQKNV